MDKKLIAKIIVITIVVILVGLIASWFIPIKFVVDSKDLKQYSKNGEVVLLCHSNDAMDAMWRVSDYYGTEESPDEVNTIGNSPEKSLRYPLWGYCGSVEFICIGHFSKKNLREFVVKSWEAYGKTDNWICFIPKSTKYFNIWEINPFK